MPEKESPRVIRDPDELIKAIQENPTDEIWAHPPEKVVIPAHPDAGARHSEIDLNASGELTVDADEQNEQIEIDDTEHIATMPTEVPPEADQLYVDFIARGGSNPNLMENQANQVVESRPRKILRTTGVVFQRLMPQRLQPAEKFSSAD